MTSSKHTVMRAAMDGVPPRQDGPPPEIPHAHHADEEYVQAIEKLDQARRDNSRLKAANEALRESERAKQTVINDLQDEMAVTQEERNDLWNSQKSLALENATLQVKVRELTLALDKALQQIPRGNAKALGSFKADYWTVDGNQSTAYVEEQPDGTFVATDKHTDEQTTITWDAANETWRAQ